MSANGCKIAKGLLQAALLAAMFMSPALGEQTIEFYKRLYGEAESSPRVERARKVFDRVQAAADRSGSRYPEFAVLRGVEEPLAKALPDGGVVVNQRALAVCYKSKDLKKGDDRLAFVLGHELAHLVIDSVGDSFASVESLSHPQVAGEADRRGLLFMTMAGYRPESLLEGSQTLFQDWLQAGPPDLLDTAASRAKEFKERLEGFQKSVPLFQSALTLYLVGNYPQAIELFKQFRKKFPSREVFHNLGVSYLQQALGVLALCDGSLLVRFSLPVQADPWTLAERVRLRGEQPSCLDSDAFKKNADQAQELLEQALSRNSEYLPALIHLATLKVLKNEVLEAMAKATQALKSAPDDPYALNIWAVSTFLEGKERELPDFKETARERLKGLLDKHPEFLPARFNLARMEKLTGRIDEAVGHWKTYLDYSPPDEMARAAAEELDRDPISVQAPASKLSPPIPLGHPSRETLDKLNSMKLLQPVDSIRIYTDDEKRIIRIGRSLEVVEVFSGLPDPASLKGLPAVQGSTPLLSIFLEGKGVALKVIGGQLQSRLFFRPPFEEAATAVDQEREESTQGHSPQEGAKSRFSHF